MAVRTVPTICPRAVGKPRTGHRHPFSRHEARGAIRGAHAWAKRRPAQPKHAIQTGFHAMSATDTPHPSRVPTVDSSRRPGCDQYLGRQGQPGDGDPAFALRSSRSGLHASCTAWRGGVAHRAHRSDASRRRDADSGADRGAAGMTLPQQAEERGPLNGNMSAIDSLQIQNCGQRTCSLNGIVLQVVHIAQAGGGKEEGVHTATR